MKIPAVPLVRPATLVKPTEEFDSWSMPDYETGLTSAETMSIDGMTLETSRRLTAAVSNLAAFFSRDPQFSAVVNLSGDGDQSAMSIPELSAPLVQSIQRRTGASAANGTADLSVEPSSGPAFLTAARAGNPLLTKPVSVVEISAAPVALPNGSVFAVDVVPDAATQMLQRTQAVPPVIDELDPIASAIDNLRTIRNDNQIAEPIAAQVINDIQINGNQRESEATGDGEGGDEQQDRDTGPGEIDGSTILQREQGNLPLVPFNRRLETNGVDQRLFLEAAFLSGAHAYGGHDANNWIVPLTIGSPRMSTDGGASPLPMSLGGDEQAPVEPFEASLLLPATARGAAPLAILAPARAVRPTWRRRRFFWTTTQFQRFFSARHLYKMPLRLTNFSLSDPRSIGVVERAVCWVDADPARRGRLHFDAGDYAFRIHREHGGDDRFSIRLLVDQRDASLTATNHGYVNYLQVIRVLRCTPKTDIATLPLQSNYA